MAWYSTGTLTLVNGSTTVVGVGTDFISGANVGEALYLNDNLYEIGAIVSATQLTLVAPYLGSTDTGITYKIIPTQSLVADLAAGVSDLITDYSDVKDTAGAGKFNDGTVTAPGITFESDQNNGLYRINQDNWGLVAGGEKIVDVSTNGIKLDDNNKATFGTGDDLQIYHDGSNSYVKDTGTGNLWLQGSSQVNIGGANGTVGVQVNEGSSTALRHNNAVKFTTTSTGVDVTGTVTADGLTVDGSTRINDSEFFIADNNTGTTAKLSMDIDTTNGARIRTTVNGATDIQPLGIYTGGTQRLKIDTNGDVHFFEDTGTTAKMVWSSSAESLGIGTIPEEKLHVEDGDVLIERTLSTGAQLTFKNNASNQFSADKNYHQFNFITANGASETTGGYARIKAGQENSGSNNSTYIGLWTAPSGGTVAERMRIDSSGNVGIGTASPSLVGGDAGTVSHVSSSTRAGVRVTQTPSGGDTELRSFGGGGSQLINNANGHLSFGTNGSERARIDSSGNLLVNATSTLNNGKLFVQGESGKQAIVTKTTTDGNSHIQCFNSSNSVTFQVTGSGVVSHSALLTPRLDNTVNMGTASARYKDLYLSGGVYLGGTGSANKLDDYETGNFTPNDNNLDYTSRVGRYEKIGRLVHVQGFFVVPTNTNANEADISLPFLYNEAGTHYLVCDVSTTNGTLSGIKGRLDSQGAGGQYIHIVNADETRVSLSELSGKSIRFSATYRTDS